MVPGSIAFDAGAACSHHHAAPRTPPKSRIAVSRMFRARCFGAVPETRGSRWGAGGASGSITTNGALTFADARRGGAGTDRKSTRLNSSHVEISYAVFCLKKKNDPRPQAGQGG